MFLAHGDTPFHDDPAVLNWIGLAVTLGPAAAASFLWFWLTHSDRGATARRPPTHDKRVEDNDVRQA
jgi:hypothetical protein